MGERDRQREKVCLVVWTCWRAAADESPFGLLMYVRMEITNGWNRGHIGSVFKLLMIFGDMLKNCLIGAVRCARSLVFDESLTLLRDIKGDDGVIYMLIGGRWVRRSVGRW